MVRISNNNMRKVILILISLVSSLAFLIIISLPGRNLQIIACDVGQGDAILIQNGTTQILIDGGPDSKVLKCLEQYISFWDRNIELVILTHPQRDHYRGLIDVFEKYHISDMLVNGSNASSPEYQVLHNMVGGSDTDVHVVRTNTEYRLGLIYLDILNPDGDLGLANSNEDPNKFSIVALLTFGNFNALFTGDIEQDVSDKLARNASLVSTSIEYLKVPHHGSKNGLSKLLAEAIRPQIAVISCGKKNKFGHPNRETLELLDKIDAEVYRTDQLGNIEIISDGKMWWKN